MVPTVILHIGAHRCATTSFQYYLRKNAADLSRDGIEFWGPGRMRGGLNPASGSSGRLALHLERARRRKVETLVISDENMLGSMRQNLLQGNLYPGVGARLARVHAAYRGRIGAVMLNIRAQDHYWPSVLGYMLAQGRGTTDQDRLAQLAGLARSWRDVIRDVAGALPGIPLRVFPFERFADRPDAQLRQFVGRPVPRGHARERRNATPQLAELRALVPVSEAASLPQGQGGWQPFDACQLAAMREIYADDMMWLAAGADGLARLACDPDNERQGDNPAISVLTRGRQDDIQESRMAGNGPG